MPLLAFLRRRIFGAPSPMTIEAFRDEIVATGRRRFPGMPLRLGEKPFVLHSGDKSLNVAHLYAAARAERRRTRTAMIASWLARFTPEEDARTAALDAASDSWAGARPLLRPKLLGTLAPVMQDRLSTRPFVGDLTIAYAIDMGDRDIHVSKTKLAGWGVPQDEVHAQAIANLEAMSTGLALEAHPAGSGRVIHICIADGYDAARLLLPDLRARLLATLGSPFCAGVPARDLLLCWSASDQAFDAGMTDLVRNAASQMQHAVSGRLFKVDESGVAPA